MLKIARLAFGFWLFVEILSWVKILPLTLEFTWLGLVVTASFAWGILEIISWRLRRVGARNLWGLTYFAALFSQCVDAFGDISRFYGKFGWYDQFAHFVGGAVVALVIFDLLLALQDSGRLNLPAKGRAIIAICVSMAAGSLYELEEYGEDVFFNSNRLGNAFDTGNDMFLNTLGAAVLIWLIYFIRRRRKLL
jgi:hypothetical protein